MATHPLLAEETDPLLNHSAESDVPLESNLVGWEDEADPEHPYNWSRWQTIANCFLVSAMTFTSALASSITAPGVPQIMKDFNNESLELAGFVVSVYIFGFVAGPLIFAPLSELYGRVPIYHLCNMGFTVFVAACTVAPNIETLILLRFVSGIFGSCPATNGGGSIADMIPQQRRGSVMSAYTIAGLFAPIIGPILGGVLTSAVGWRWTFWLLTILGGGCQILMFFMLKETYHPIILDKKTRQLRAQTGNLRLQSKLGSDVAGRDYLLRSITRPFKMLLFSPIVTASCVSIAVTYGYIYLLLTSLTHVFQTYYGLSTSKVGLCFLGLGIGSILGVAIFSRASDRTMKRKTAQSMDGISKPEFRLPPLIPAYICLQFGLIMFGWTAEYRLNLVFPILGTVFIGIGQLICYMALLLYLVDAFQSYTASAVAVITAVRSIAGALLPLFGLTMYDKIGVGWSNTLLAVVCLPLLLIAVILEKYGEFWRKRFDIKNI